MPVTEAVKGLSAVQAATVPAKGFNSVWAVVNHIWHCQKVVLYKLQAKSDGRQDSSDETDWPPISDPMDENAWLVSCERVNTVTQELAQVIAGLPQTALEQPVESDSMPAWQLIHGAIAHNGYHACEIISIRHLLGLWMENV